MHRFIFFESDIDISKQIEYVKNSGYSTYEFWTWWDKDLEKIKSFNQKYGLKISAMCTKFISLTDEAKRNEYVQGLNESIKAAKLLGVKILITQTGDDIGIDRNIQRKSMIDGLLVCSPILKKAGINLLVEPLNLLIDHEGYFLSTSDETYEIGGTDVFLD